MVKWIKQLFCKHKRTYWDHSDLEKQKDGSWQTVHYWECKHCGKIFTH